MPLLPPYFLRTVHREPRGFGNNVQEVQRLSRVHLPVVSEENAAAHRRGQEAAGQFPRVQFVGDGDAAKTKQNALLRHLQDDLEAAKGGHEQVLGM